MTAPATAPVAEVLNTAGRYQQIQDLHRDSHKLSHHEVRARLRRLAHRDLPWMQARLTFETYELCVEHANAMRDGVADWSEFYSEDTLRDYPGTLHNAALELLDFEASESLRVLATGEC